MKYFFCYFLFSLISTELFSATNTIVKGNIIEGNLPIEFVNIIIYNQLDTTKIIRVTTTDSLGNFQLQDLDFGNYILKTNLIGYTKTTVPFSLTISNSILQLPTIKITSSIHKLNSVNIKAQKQLIQKTKNGIIINAQENISQIGGTATDLLRNTPTVLVDAEGGISIRGKAPMILINGRNSGLNSTDRIPANSIESIEIINNPSAKYDADAEGGIINITLKKNKAKGINGTIGLGGGYGAKPRLNSGFIINQNNKNLNIGLSYDNRFANRTRKATAERINFFLPNEYHLSQNRHDLRYEETHNLKFNADYNLDKRNTISLEMLTNYDVQNNNETLVSKLETQQNNFISKNTRHSLEYAKEKLAEVSLNYSRTFIDKRKTFSANISTSYDFDTENTDITTQALNADESYLGTAYLQRTHNYQHSDVSNLKLDFSQPITSRSSLDMGYKGILRITNADYQSLFLENNNYIENQSASNLFSFNEQIHAIYFQYKSSLGKKEIAKWNYDIGIRAENVTNHGEVLKSNLLFKNNYFKLFPSANIIYSISENDFIKFGVNRRINRPDLEQLNPFVDITDSLNPHTGNPYLKPELISAAELMYNIENKKTQFSISLFYRYATNIIKSFISLDTNGVALVKPINFGNGISTGTEVLFSAEVTKFWNFTISTSLFQQKIKDTSLYNSHLSYYSKITNNFILWKGAKLQLMGNYNSPIATPQGTKVAVYNIDAGFQQKILKNKGAIGIVLTDLFNTQKSGITAASSEFNYYRNFKVDTRALLITFVYSFKNSFKEELLENKFSND